MNGPKAIPGEYKVALIADGKEIVKDFEILPDPRSTATKEDLQAQFAYLQSVVDKVTETHEAITDLRATKDQINDVLEQIKDVEGAEEVKKMGKEITKELTAIEEKLYQTKNRSSQDPLNYPIRLNNKLAHLNSLMAVGDFKPTDSAIEFKKEVSAKIDKELNALSRIYQLEIPEFNQKVKQLDWNPVEVKSLK